MGVLSRKLIFLMLCCCTHFRFGKSVEIETTTNVLQKCLPEQASSCHCSPNLKWNSTTQACDAIACQYVNDCSKYSDPNRVCRTWNATAKKYCLCKDGYVANRTTFVCEQNKTASQTPLNPDYYCENNYTCLQYNSDTNLICVDKRCKCAPNYVWSDDLTYCLRSKCRSNSDCKIYDQNRICDLYDESQCVCAANYYEDPVTKKCLNNTSVIPYRYCYYRSNCNSNEFCINNQCECEPNYRYNPISKSCLYQDCANTTDCSAFDKNRICSYGDCDCRYGYEIDSVSRLCVITTTPTIPYQYCYSSNYCGTNQICVKSKCQCMAGYVYSKYGVCEYNGCTYSSDCQTYDPNRQCKYSSCQCKSGFKENSSTKFCNTTVGTTCFSNYDCTSSGDSTQLCIDSVCQCQPNYKWSDDYGECTYYSCNIDYDCQKYDLNRYCDSYGNCLCSHSYSEDTYDKKCYYNVEYNNTSSVWWIWILVVIPVLVIISALIRVTRRRVNQPLSRSTQTRNAATISQRVTINDTPPFTISDPPPPYSRY